MSKGALFASLLIAALTVAGASGVRVWMHSDHEPQYPPIGTPETVGSVAPAPSSRSPAETSVIAPDQSLKARLNRLRDWIAANHANYLEKFNRLKDDPDGLTTAHAEYQTTYEELTRGLRELIFADPRTFLEFLKSIHEAPVLAGLLFPLPRRPLRDLDDVPEALLRGLAEVLQAGSEIQRQEILNIVWMTSKVPEPFLPVYDLLLAAPTPEIQRLALMALANGGCVSERHVPALQEMVVSGRDPQLTSTAISTLANMAAPAATRFILDQFHTATRTDIMDAMAEHLPVFLARNRENPAAHAEGLKRTFTLVAAHPPESAALYYGSDGYFFRRLVYVTLDQLPSSHAQEVLSAVVECAPTVRLREGTRKILEAIEKGETRRDALVRVYLRHLDIAAAGR